MNDLFLSILGSPETHADPECILSHAGPRLPFADGCCHDSYQSPSTTPASDCTIAWNTAACTIFSPVFRLFLSLFSCQNNAFISILARIFRYWMPSLDSIVSNHRLKYTPVCWQAPPHSSSGVATPFDRNTLVECLNVRPILCHNLQDIRQ